MSCPLVSIFAEEQHLRKLLGVGHSTTAFTCLLPLEVKKVGEKTFDIPIWHLLLHNVSPAVFNYEKIEDKCRKLPIPYFVRTILVDTNTNLAWTSSISGSGYASLMVNFR